MKLIQPTNINGTNYCLTGSLQRTPYVLSGDAVLSSQDVLFGTISESEGRYEFGVGCGTGVSVNFDFGGWTVDVDVLVGTGLYTTLNFIDSVPQNISVIIPMDEVGVCETIEVIFYTPSGAGSAYAISNVDVLS